MSFSQTIAPAKVVRAAEGATDYKAVRLWLFTVAALIFVMVLVGGATRLTESGLSITEWKPVTGVIPPLNGADWQAAFSAYKQIPQYSQMFPDMTLSEFKTIYFWEWSHRLLARIIGAAFILPLLWFWAKGRLRGIGLLMLLPTGLLALEPIVGWWMVASGLSRRVEVSQVRLAIHLLIATATYGALLWIAVGLSERRREAATSGLKWASGLIACLVFCQIGFGALVAGLRAGLIDNTWPLMEGRLIPADLWPQSPWWSNLYQDAASAQFQHRILAYAIVLLALWHAVAAMRRLPGSSVARRAAAVAGLALSQAAIGIATLLLVVPIGAGLLHQAFAMLLFGMAVAHWRATALG
ncbi:MAG TPA: COX15/CtaA family protein [Roseiarcus sp.]|nr:COX15/CtaA family protein [Roseiarcus sp.]